MAGLLDMLGLGQQQGGATPNAPFVQQFQAQNPQGNPDQTYGAYMQNIQTPAGPLPNQQSGPIMSAIRGLIPWMDSSRGHQQLGNAMSLYPYTPQFQSQMPGATVVRDSANPDLARYEASTDPEHALGIIPTGRSRMDITNQPMTTKPSVSVIGHELIHSYVNKNGFPGKGEDAFNTDWEAAKKTTPLLQQIDTNLRSDPDYADEMNKDDITNERLAYLGQALGGGGLEAFPQNLRPYYAGIYQDIVGRKGRK